MQEDIKKSVEVLRNGGVILYPTDTVWGLGCDAGNEEAVARIYNIKKRSDSKSMLVLIDHEGRLESYVREVPEIAWELLDASDRPLTIIYPGAKNLAKNLIAEDGSIGIRITDDAFCSRLINSFGRPIVSTSANISGEKAAAIFDEISEEIKEAVDFIPQWRRDDYEKRPPSSIIKLGEGGLFKIIRP
ncbi:MAG: threonylcarbamoyl-AMP synthase [Bacteroidales bacterium]|nr:threonylcarbamoyl-AMP synthase [Bacteroidales bacterium]